MNKKRYGQNFLNNELIALEIVDSLELKEEDNLIEVGCGNGILTFIIALNYKIKNFIVIEIDNGLVERLNQELEGLNQKQIQTYPIAIHSDALKINIAYNKVKIVSNLAFNITKPFLNQIVDYYIDKLDLMIVMLQEEFKDIFMKNKSAFGSYMSTFFDIKPLISVKSHMFDPQPKVNGIVLEFKVKNNIDHIYKIKDQYFKYLKLLFKEPKKNLNHIANNKILHIPQEYRYKKPHMLSLIEIYQIFLNQPTE